jgi:hypothetical protein
MSGHKAVTLIPGKINKKGGCYAVINSTDQLRVRIAFLKCTDHSHHHVIKKDNQQVE